MTMESDEEMAYNEEFDQLVNERLKCPTCNSAPIEFGVVTICESGHYYIIQEENT